MSPQLERAGVPIITINARWASLGNTKRKLVIQVAKLNNKILENGFKDMRRRKVWPLVLFLCFLPYMVLAGFNCDRVHLPEKSILIAAIPYITLYGTAGI